MVLVGHGTIYGPGMEGGWVGGALWRHWKRHHLGLISKWRLRLDLLLKLRHFQMSQCYVSELEQQILSQAALVNQAQVLEAPVSAWCSGPRC